MSRDSRPPDSGAIHVSLPEPERQALLRQAKAKHVDPEEVCTSLLLECLRSQQRQPGKRRNRSITAKVTEVEYVRLKQLAEARGIRISEWAREVMLGLADPEHRALVFELVALRQFLTALVVFLGTNGAAITPEQLLGVQLTADEKAKTRALKILAKARANEPEYLVVEPGQDPPSKETSHVK